MLNNILYGKSMSDTSHQKFVPAVQNAVQILRLLALSDRPKSATNLARDAGMNVSSAFNILRTLVHEGFVTMNAETKTYRVGMGLLDVAVPLLGISPAELMRPMLKDIAQEYRVMIAMWQFSDSDKITLIDNIAADQVVQVSISRESRLPAFAGAIGRCYAAAKELDEEATRAGYETVQWQSPPGFKSYWADVLAARESGCAFDHGQLFRGLEIVASLALNAEQKPCIGLSSITIAGQHDASSLDAVAEALIQAARRIETAVFARPPCETNTDPQER